MMVSCLELLLCVYIVDLATAGVVMPTPDSDDNEVSTYDFPFTTRAMWLAKPPVKKLPLRVPVPYVVIHHSYIPAACYDGVKCRQAMRSMQKFHMESKGWWDIGYHFAVGSDGVAYEGRGWTVLGAHALHFNNVSIGICLIGDWRNAVPPPEQLKTAQSLIAAGVDLGYIKTDYKLVGHRQVRETDCPGDALYQEIQHWEHYSPVPHSVDDLVNIDLTGSADLDVNEVSTYDFPFTTRAMWLAKPPVKKLPLRVPVPYVVIHHSYIPAACYDGVKCRQAMRSMQKFHMESKGWWDIGYHFAVGSDGVAYEGRGWTVLGAHALHFNNVSIGICLIGDWRNAVPPPEQLKTAQSLIAAGVDLGYIKTDYKLVGHRQVRETDCPGDALYQEIQHWEHYSPVPHSVDDLVNIDLPGSDSKNKNDILSIMSTHIQ